VVVQRWSPDRSAFFVCVPGFWPDSVATDSFGAVADNDEPPSSTLDSLPPKKRHFFFDPRIARGRLALGGIAGLVAAFVTPRWLPWNVRAMVGWDAGALLFVLLAWAMISGATAEQTRIRAAAEDTGRRLVFVIAVVSSVFSLFSAIVVLKQVHTLPSQQVPIFTGLALAAVVLSWLVTHTAYTLRYAHLYYRRRGTTKCLRFEGTVEPRDIDFAYFAFTIGMCFQVSDVVIASGTVRRAALIHALVSFAFNTTILALALNLVTFTLG